MFQSLPPVTRALVFINVGVFLAEMLVGNVLFANFALWPLGGGSDFEGVPGFQPWQIVTYSFLHASVSHLLFNMLALYMFGGELERLFGQPRFLQLYCSGIVAAAIAQLLVAALLGGEPHPTIGASGGVFGLLLAYGMYFPNRTVVLLIPPIPMPAWVFVLVYGAIELLLGVTGTQEGVAHFAHLGGMVGAWLLIRSWRLPRI